MFSGRICHNSGHPSGGPLTCASMAMQGVHRLKGNYAYSAASGIEFSDRLVQTGHGESERARDRRTGYISEYRQDCRILEISLE